MGKYYLLLRSNAGELKITDDEWNDVIGKYSAAGQPVVISDSDEGKLEEKRSNFLNGRGFEQASNVDEKINLIPTLLQIDNTSFEKRDSKTTAQLSRVYDNNIIKTLKIGSKLNFMLPYLDDEKDEKETLDYTFQSDSGEITFRLPKYPVEKMVIATIKEISQTKPNDADKYHISASFYKDIQKGSKSKGEIDFLNYADIPDEFEMLLFDEQMGVHFVFDCKIAYFPTPGKDEGVFIYVDGSSQKTKNAGKGQDEVYGAGVVISHDKAVYFDLATGKSNGANYDGEIVAATNAFKYLEDIASDTDDITVFFDNTAIGYTATGIFKVKAESEIAVGYKNELVKFRSKFPNVKLDFVHVDGHFAVLGNEMADRMAQVNDGEFDKPEKFTSDFTGKREQLVASQKESGFPHKFKLI
jgi:ribonuclease HI